MVAGHLQEKNGVYYVVLSYRDPVTGKRKQPWINTGLPVKGNKKKAEKKLDELRRKYDTPGNTADDLSGAMLFADYMEHWLKIIKGSVEVTTYSSYCYNVNKKIVPYFRKKGITLEGLQAKHLQAFYLHELEHISGTSLQREHANIHKALKYAVQLDLIPSNPADRVERPKKTTGVSQYYSAEEMEQFLELTKDHKLALLFQLTAFYGLRRSEVVGLKWDNIDFESNIITIRHVVTQVPVDGKVTLVEADRAKNRSSVRSLPLVGNIRERLLQLKRQQEENRKICGNSYNQDFLGYVFVDEMGNLYKPNTVSESFRRELRKHSLRKIKFHDIRHSCASLLLKNGVNPKLIQEWLGHSDISTTMNIYAHLDTTSKDISAAAMSQALSLPEYKGTYGWQRETEQPQSSCFAAEAEGH